MSKIMVIDDEKDTLELAKAVLEIEGFEVIIFDESSKALKEIKSGNKPDLILLDIRMPRISGPQLCDKLLEDENTKKIKIVYFTASSDINKEESDKKNVLGYIFKPFENKKLVSSIKKYLGK